MTFLFACRFPLRKRLAEVDMETSNTAINWPCARPYMEKGELDVEMTVGHAARGSYTINSNYHGIPHSDGKLRMYWEGLLSNALCNQHGSTNGGSGTMVHGWFT